jgi:regulator of sirC expression with transglutaminase-like and TPR domain
VDSIGHASEREAAEKELDRLTMRISAFLMGNRDPHRTVSALNRVTFDEEKFAYDTEPGNPENFLLDRVIVRKRGNCLGLTLVYLTLAERLGLPLRAVYVPSHSFVRYEGNGARINIAMEQGCRFEPSMLEILNRYRAPGEFSTSH